VPLQFDIDAGAIVSARDKGMPGHIADLPITEVGAQRWNLLAEDLPLPAAILSAPALDRNSAWMRDFIAARNVALAPHGKTTMAPTLFNLQMRDGAWGVTVSTAQQIAAARAAGHRRIFVANQIVGRASIRYVLEQIAQDDALELYCLVDSIALAEQTEAVAAAMDLPRPLCVLVEKGFAGGRTGCRTVDEALAVARVVAASPHLSLVGIEGFEGIIRKSDAASTLLALETFLAEVVALAEACDAQDLFESQTILLSAGGSAFFDLVVAAFDRATLSRPHMSLLRSGCYITHDSIMYTKLAELLERRAPELFTAGGLEPALHVWAYVQSRPEPTRAIVTMGKRDVSYDDLPVASLWFRPGGSMLAPRPMPADHRVVALNDQHGFLDIPADSSLAVGDMVAFGISHPCLTFDKWRVLSVVDQAYDVVGAVRTYF
jgi:D-serine dehydratase